MYKASCGCGSVRLELSEPPSMMATCHCSRCRKFGMSTFVFVTRRSLMIVAGEVHIITHIPPAPLRYTRSHCERCGTSLGEITSADETFPIPANLFDTPVDLVPRFHEFVADKPDWYEICDTAKQFAGHPVKSAQ